MANLRCILVLLQAASIASAHPHHRRATGSSVSIQIHKHAFVNAIPVPSAADELAAAKQPDYIHWAAQHVTTQSASNSSSLQRRFATAEHMSLGDSLVLTGTDGSDLTTPATFTLPNGLNLTYGEINGLGGDYYATYNPISDGANLTDRVARFKAAYALLATDTTRQPAEALSLLAIAANERTAFAAAVAAGTDPSKAYSELPDSSAAYELATISRPSDEPGYAGISAINWDHFGADARLAYDAGHFAALSVAAGGDLLTGYTMNAFADHFLEDSFAAGHMRTPRRLLHDFDEAADLCAEFMHDEDNAIGLNVTNPNGDSWTAYGDDYLMDEVDLDNLAHIHNALQISVAEVLAAYTSGVAPTTDADVEAFGVWAEAPVLSSLLSTTEQSTASSGGQTLAPLFTSNGWRREDMNDRYAWNFTYSYTYLTTLAELEVDDAWTYPITMDT